MTATNEGLDEDRAPSLGKAALSVLLGFVALSGVAAAAGVVAGVLATQTGWSPWLWQPTVLIAVCLLIGGGAIWGLLRLRPWQGEGGPVSPTTRRTRRLYWLTELAAALAGLALIYGTQLMDRNDLPFGVFSHGMDNATGMFSNRPLPAGIAIFAITSWVLAMGIGLWRYASADEHERQANDFGKLVAFRLFYVVTPAWWVAARADLLPQPNAMLLWFVTLWVAALGWFWRRYR